MIVLSIVALGVLAALLVLTTGRRSDRERAEEVRVPDRELVSVGGRAFEREALVPDVLPMPAAPVSTFVRYDPDELGVTRRQFLNRGVLVMLVLGVSAFGGSVLAFLWPSLSGGFGSKVDLGKLDDLLAQMETGGPVYIAEARTWLSPYPNSALPKAEKVYDGAVLAGMEVGVVALYQKCVHLGCRVPFCADSKWFECGCHGSKYNRVGEQKNGPAPRGLDRFGVTVDKGQVIVDTSTVVVGPPIGVNTTGQEAEGPHCHDSPH